MVSSLKKMVNPNGLLMIDQGILSINLEAVVMPFLLEIVLLKKIIPVSLAMAKGKDPRVILFSKDFDKKLELKVFNQEPLIFDLEHSDNNPKKNIEKMLNYLYENSYQSLLVEGGGTTFTHFLNENIFDELQIFYAPKIIGTGFHFLRVKKA